MKNEGIYKFYHSLTNKSFILLEVKYTRAKFTMILKKEIISNYSK